MKMRTAFILAIFLSIFAYFLIIKNSQPPRIPVISIEKNNGYHLMVDAKPFIIRGVCYNPIPIGRDCEYNFFGDMSQSWLSDGKLMKEMGVNTVRFYRVGKNPAEVRQVLDDLYKKFGIHSLVGTYLGFWDWPPPNYANPQFRDRIKSEVLEMVRLYKDSPGVLMWVLGNENNYSFDRNVQRWTTDAIDALPTPEAQRKEKARIYYSFVNDLAREIKRIDTKHPVAMGVGEVASLDLAQPVCPDVDVIGMIAYRGPTFGNLFRQVTQKFDRPVVMIEWGADSYNVQTREPDEKNQSEFLSLQWQDIERNVVGHKGEGNSLGGTLFEWNDEWWKSNENLPHTWTVHDTAGHWQNTAYYTDAYGADKLNMNEEWWGVVSMEPKKSAGDMDERAPKKAYFALKDLWTKHS